MAFTTSNQSVPYAIYNNHSIDYNQTVNDHNHKLGFVKALALVTLLIGAMGHCHAQAIDGYKTIYKSTGKFGETKYSQFEPKSGTHFEVIQMRHDGRQNQPGLYAPNPNNQSDTTQSSFTQSKTALTSNSNQTTAKTSNSKSATHLQCQKLNNNLLNLQASGDIYESISGGERRYLSPPQVAVKIEETQSLLDNYCQS
ncbi:hypothetical protein [Psychrobacter sp.]|uniref:hypothetical protein n=1 Tax=Psychrobacter sp. TaxID=56811 RepID=UPI0025EF1E8E|nr:hypothetical protein [Psychrobacter sp.]